MKGAEDMRHRPSAATAAAAHENGGSGSGGHAHPPNHGGPGSAICCFARTLGEGIVGYFAKWQGSHGKDPASVPSLRHSFISLLQAALSITVLCFLDTGVHAGKQDFMFLVASFGATAVLLYSSHQSPLAQPRNVLVGHFVSSIAGVTVYKIMGEAQPYLAAGFAVGLAIFFMERTNSVHPPGGATALVAVIGSEKVHKAGYLFVAFPCLTGALFMVLIALVCNNLDTHRVYPLYWSKFFPILERLWTCAAAILLPEDAAQRRSAAAAANANAVGTAEGVEAVGSSSNGGSEGGEDWEGSEEGMVEVELGAQRGEEGGRGPSPSPPPGGDLAPGQVSSV